jgi:hypothetical protein
MGISNRLNFLLLTAFYGFFHGLLGWGGTGCGKRAVDFQWSSSNPTVATVNALGVVQTKGLGSAVIRVSALYDVHNNDEVSFDGPKFIWQHSEHDHKC